MSNIRQVYCELFDTIFITQFSWYHTLRHEIHMQHKVFHLQYTRIGNLIDMVHTYMYINMTNINNNKISRVYQYNH